MKGKAGTHAAMREAGNVLVQMTGAGHTLMGPGIRESQEHNITWEETQALGTKQGHGRLTT